MVAVVAVVAVDESSEEDGACFGVRMRIADIR